MINSRLLTIFILILSSIKAFSSGYMLETNNTDSISTGLNNGAEASNPSVISANPAGITYLNGTFLSNSLIIPNLSVKYYDAKGYYFKTHEMVAGQNNATLNSTSFVPSLFFSTKINDNIYAGIAIFPAMGAVIDYDMTSVLRYNINKLQLVSLNVQPTIAFKINERNSIGLGLVIQNSESKLREFADFNAGINYSIPILGAAGYKIIPRKTDVYANIKSEDLNIGFNLGYMWNINDNFRMGIAYNSRIKHTLKGTASWEFYGEAFDWPLLGDILKEGIRGNGYVEKESIKVVLKNPESINIHTLWKVNPKLNLLTQAVWTRHSVFNDFSINFENYKIIPNGKTGLNDAKSNIYQLKPVWKNTWRFGIGATYQLNDKLQLRTGISYDKTPIKDPSSRFTALPDNDTISIGLGTNYAINKNSNVTLAYMYEKLKNTNSDVNGWCGSSVEIGPNAKNCIASRTSASTNFKIHANLYGIQYNYKF